LCLSFHPRAWYHARMTEHNPTKIPRNKHSISRSDISDNTLKVLYHLRKFGFKAFLVGGGVRDLLLRVAPKDFDVATNAKPEEIRRLFRNCRLIGRRFRLAHILYGRDIVEVATFRASSENVETVDQNKTQHGLITRDNIYGTIEEDAVRRDFTINALYYTIEDFSVIDYVGGLGDLKNKIIRLIGEPETRYREDPVRILRAIRFAAKLNFTIEKQTENAISTTKNLLQHVPSSRLFDEILKLFHHGHGADAFLLLQKYKIISELFPLTHKCLALKQFDSENLIKHTLVNTDDRVKEKKPVSPAFLFAALLWHPAQVEIARLEESGQPFHLAFEQAAELVIRNQIKIISIPKRFTGTIREIWAMQYRLPNRTPKRSFRLLYHRRFRAGYDFLLVRAAIGEAPKELADWWTHFQAAPEDKQHEMIGSLKKQKRKKPSRKKKK